MVRQAGGRAEGVFLALTFVVQREAWVKLEEFRPFVKLGMEMGVDLARAKGEEVKVADGKWASSSAVSPWCGLFSR